MPRPGPRTIARYSEQFKATAVRLSRCRVCKYRMLPSLFTSTRSCCLVGAGKLERETS